MRDGRRGGANYKNHMGLKDLENELYSSQGPRERESKYRELKKMRAAGEDDDRAGGRGSKEQEWIPEEVKPAMARPAKKVKIKMPSVSFPKLFIFIGVLIFVGLGLFVYSYIGTLRSQGDTGISVDGPQEILVGVPFEVHVHIANESRNILSGAELEIELPEDLRVSQSLSAAVFSRPIADIRPGETIQETVKLVALGGRKSSKEILFSIKYSLPGVNSRFSQSSRFIANVRESGLRLDVVYPNKALAGEEFSVDFSYTNTSNVPFDQASLVLKYPDGYTFLRASKNPAQGSSTWKFNTIAPGETGKITLIGRVSGIDGSFFNISAQLFVPIDDRQVILDEKGASVSIAASPLAVSVTVNNTPDFVASTNQLLQYTITYKNNSDVGLKDVIIKARLVGEMYDFKSLRASGFFESINNTVTWNAASVPDLRLVQPGASGAVNFSIATKREYPIRRLSDKNYILKIHAVVESPTVPFFVSYEKTTGIGELQTKVAGKIGVDAKAFFRDAASGFLNSGPFPPKVNTPTQYTVHWIISNYATDVRNIEVRSVLKSGATLTGKVKSNVPNSVPTFNERTSELAWYIDKAYAGQGIVDEPLEAVFQIQFTPSILDVGKASIELIGDTHVIAHDEFTDTQLEAVDAGLNTGLQDDPTVQQGSTQVVE